MRKFVLQVQSSKSQKWIDFRHYESEATIFEVYENLEEPERFRIVERYEHVLS